MQPIEPVLHQRVWGVRDLRPFIDLSELSNLIGEAWFQRPGLPLLKWIFTAERLSVQVHPDDTYAAQCHNSRGKTEAWYVLDAKPGAQIGLGLRRRMTKSELRQAAVSGDLEVELHWFGVSRGQCFLVEAGTIHAIGAGLVVLEIQQDSDITYRLFDYGRGRELHLDHGVEVARPCPWEGAARRGPGVLADSPYFRLVSYPLVGESTIGGFPNPAWIVCASGEAVIGGTQWRMGQVGVIEPGDSLMVSGDGAEVLAGFVP